MNSNEKLKKLYNVYGNPTKLNVMLLLSEYDRMTVTQMSKHVNISRSNLYHFVSEMVKDTVLNEPEVKVKGNYVEKYYSLNSDLFKVTQLEESRHVSTMSSQEIRELVRSLLVGFSFNLGILAERIAHTSDQQVEKLREAYLNQSAVVAYFPRSLFSPKIQEHLRKIQDELENSDEPKGKEQDFIRIMILALPSL